MKKIYVQIFGALFFISSVTSCQKDISLTVNPKYNKPLLVLNSVLQADSTATVQVSQSGSLFNNTQPSLVTDAAVELWENGNYKMKMNYNNGMYSCNYLPKAGNSYTIKATKLNFDNAEGTTTIPNASAVLLKNYDSINHTFAIQINDLASVSDYYNIKMFTTDNTHQIIQNQVSVLTDESAILGDTKEQNNGGGHGGSSQKNYQALPNFITDQYFNGTSNTYSFIYQPDNTFPIDYNHYVLKVENVSAEIYWYDKSIKDYRNNNGNSLSEPVVVYSNVKNGLGVVGSRVAAPAIILK